MLLYVGSLVLHAYQCHLPECLTSALRILARDFQYIRDMAGQNSIYTVHFHVYRTLARTLGQSAKSPVETGRILGFDAIHIMSHILIQTCSNINWVTRSVATARQLIFPLNWASFVRSYRENLGGCGLREFRTICCRFLSPTVFFFFFKLRNILIDKTLETKSF